MRQVKNQRHHKGRRKKLRFLEILEIIFLTLAFSFSLIMLIPRLFNIEPKIVLSGSMYPTYNAGAVVFVDKNKTLPEVGDIIAYSTGEAIITHRVIGTESGGAYITKGDANDSEDLSPVSQAQVVGTIIFWIPLLGYGISFATSKKGIIIIATILVVYYLFTKLLGEVEEDP